MDDQSALARKRQFPNIDAGSVQLSVVIPVFNETESVEFLHRRLSETLAAMGKSYEVIYVDDGSTDGSDKKLGELYRNDPKMTVIRFNRNYGQHAAVIAGFERCR